MEIPRHWRLNTERYRLEGSTCPTCGQFIFPPRPVCPRRMARAARIACSNVPVLPASIGIAEPESHSRHRITETIMR